MSSGIVGPNGQPVAPPVKEWSDMTLEEKLDVMRGGLGHLITVTAHIGRSVDRVVAALEASEGGGDDKSPSVNS